MLDKLFEVNAWLSYLISTLAILAAAELGRLAGVATRRRRAEAMSTEITTLQSASLGLLALIIGFTFSMTLTLYEARKKAVLDEANAIRTTALRAGMLPEPHASEVRNLLRDYVQLRIEMLQTRKNPRLFEATIRRSKEVQADLWQHAMAISAADPRSVTAGLFVQALNQVIDLQELRTRLFAAPSHVPGIVYLLLYTIATVAIGFSGYAVALEGKQGRIPHVILGVLVAIVIGVIADIDRPWGGFVKVSQQPILDLQTRLSG